jgi:hypothetical protein
MGIFSHFLSVFPMDFQGVTCRFLRGAKPIAAGGAGKSKSAGANSHQFFTITPTIHSFLGGKINFFCGARQ